MSSITIRFEGICTHISYPYPPEAPWYHRVVLPRPWHDEHREHLATLLIPKSAASEADVRAFSSPALEWKEPTSAHYRLQVNGVELSIPNATGDYLQERSFLCGIPRLSQYGNAWFGAPDAEVIAGRWIGAAWGYFNVRHGTFTAGIVHQGASAAVLDSSTRGKPRLEARMFVLENVRTLELEPGTILILQHVGIDADHDDDFAIHYRIIKHRPADPAGPTTRASCLDELPPTSPSLSIGPGCSNSIFP
jgi:hypothetical protein